MPEDAANFGQVSRRFAVFFFGRSVMGRTYIYMEFLYNFLF